MADHHSEFASRGYNVLGAVEFSKARYPEAKDFFGRAIALNGNWHSRLNLSAVQVAQRDFAAADQSLRQYLAYAPDSPRAMLMYYEAKLAPAG